MQFCDRLEQVRKDLNRLIRAYENSPGHDEGQRAHLHNAQQALRRVASIHENWQTANTDATIC